MHVGADINTNNNYVSMKPDSRILRQQSANYILISGLTFHISINLLLLFVCPLLCINNIIEKKIAASTKIDNIDHTFEHACSD